MKPVIGNQRLRDAPEDLEAQRAEVVSGQVGDEPVRAGARSGRAPATGRTRCDESQRAGQPKRLHWKACLVIAWRASPAIC